MGSNPWVAVAALVFVVAWGGVSGSCKLQELLAF